ncbi:MAG: transcriptional antiterminator, Rof [Gammaproteobacteria bacterium]|jgi:Rho-binding antiterminator
MTDYLPIDCGRYSEYELAILQRRRLLLGWRDCAGTLHMEWLRPVDLRSRKGAEFLRVVDHAGDEREIRLDRLIQWKST